MLAILFDLHFKCGLEDTVSVNTTLMKNVPGNRAQQVISSSLSQYSGKTLDISGRHNKYVTRKLQKLRTNISGTYHTSKTKVLGRKLLQLLHEMPHEEDFSTHPLVRGPNSHRLILKSCMRTSYTEKPAYITSCIIATAAWFEQKEYLQPSIYTPFSMAVAWYSTYLTVQTIEKMTSSPSTSPPT